MRQFYEIKIPINTSQVNVETNKFLFSHYQIEKEKKQKDEKKMFCPIE